jgi:hypothetical protein
MRCETVPALFERLEEGRMTFCDVLVQIGVIAGNLGAIDKYVYLLWRERGGCDTHRDLRVP